MFDSWDDYALAVVNPAASSYNMIMEAREGFREQGAEDAAQKRETQEANAESAAKVAKTKRNTRAAEAESKPKSSRQAGAGLGGMTRPGSRLGAGSSSSVSNETLAGGAAALLLVGALVYAYSKRSKK